MVTGGSEENQHYGMVQMILTFGQAVKVTDFGVTKIL